MVDVGWSNWGARDGSKHTKIARPTLVRRRCIELYFLARVTKTRGKKVGWGKK